MTLHCTNHNNEIVLMAEIGRSDNSCSSERCYRCPECFLEVIVDLDKMEETDADKRTGN